MKHRITASERLRKELSELLKGGSSEDGSIISALIRKGAGIILQELLEKEVGEFLGRDHYERRTKKKSSKKGYRNGYRPMKIKSAEGKIEVSLPKVRKTEEPYRSKLAEFFRGNTEVLEKLTCEMYARGLSTRDIEDALMEATGDMILSRSAVSQVTEVLHEQYEAFQNRDLSEFNLEYLFVDAIYESVRERFNMKEAVLCAWGICRDGRKVLLGLALGNKESFRCWHDFFEDLVDRGMKIPTTVSSDGGKGAIKAIEAVFPCSLRLRCWFHRMENFCAKVPANDWKEIKAELCHIRDAKSFERGQMQAIDFINEHREKFPSLVRALEDDLEALLNHLKVPENHRKRVRTTNLIERSFEEERRRTKIIPGFFTEKAALKLMFSVLIRAAKRWQKVRFSHMNLAYLNKLRKELGIERMLDSEEEWVDQKEKHSPSNYKRRKRKTGKKVC